MAHSDTTGTASERSGRDAVALRKQSDGKPRGGALRPYLTHHHGDGEPAGALYLSEADWLAVSRQLDISPQERKVVQGILAGQKLMVLAEELHLGLGTVKTYCQRIYHKLHISTHCELAVAVLAAHRNASSDSRRDDVSHGDDIHTADLMNGGGI